MSINCLVFTSREKQQEPQQDHWLQKLDKDFIDNWITYLFYTYFINDTGFYIFFFANITASYVRKKRQETK